MKSYLSATNPHIGLNIPYRLENNKKINPICSVDRPNCLKCGSNVGSRKAQVLDTTTITSPVTIIVGILTNFKIEVVLELETRSVN